MYEPSSKRALSLASLAHKPVLVMDYAYRGKSISGDANAFKCYLEKECPECKGRFLASHRPWDTKAKSIPCKREAIIAAFKAVIDDKELALEEISGFGMREAGVYLKQKKKEKVDLTVMLALTENKAGRPVQVKVSLQECYDNACRVLSAKIEDET